MKKTKIFPFGIEAKICKSLFSKARGMMFSLKPEPLLFVFKKEQNASIHMFFVFFPLIAIWLNKEKRIADFKILKPFSFYNQKIKSKYIIEIPLIDRNNKKKLVKRLRKGMQLKFLISKKPECYRTLKGAVCGFFG
jgi:uncharacterized membrane protein (UPF0127 family)